MPIATSTLGINKFGIIHVMQLQDLVMFCSNVSATGTINAMEFRNLQNK